MSLWWLQPGWKGADPVDLTATPMYPGDRLWVQFTTP